MTAGDAVEAAQVDELLDVFPADIHAAAQDHRVDGDFGPQLQALHAVEGGDDVAAHGQSAVVFQQHHVVLFQIRLDGVGHLGGAGGAVGGQGHAADHRHVLDHVVHIHGFVGHGETGGSGRMGMDDAPYVRALFIAAQMHFDLAGGTQTLGAFQHLALVVDAQQFFGGDKAFAHAGGGAQKGAVLQPGGYIAVVGRHPAQLPGFVTDVADLLLDQIDVHSRGHSFPCF